jgi:hypothetical protein
MASEQIETTIAITVHTDSDYQYQYKVEIGPDQISVSYEELDSTRPSRRRVRPLDLRFGSLDEMEAVANAMLKAIKFGREND